jgi:acetyltransferase EpsM
MRPEESVVSVAGRAQAGGKAVQKLVVLGAGGDGLVVAEAIRQASAAHGKVELAGFLDDVVAPGERVEGVPVFARLDSWRDAPSETLFVPAIQKAADMPRRAARIDGLGIPDARWGNAIHPGAVVASSAVIGRGVYLAAFASLQPDCKVGDFSSLRAGAALGHHAAVGRHAYVGPNAVMCGRSQLADGAHLGPGAVLLETRQMGRFSVAGIGAAVTKDIPEYWIVFGNPAQRVGFVKRVSDVR